MNFLIVDELLHACKHVATISRSKYHGKVDELYRQELAVRTGQNKCDVL